MNYPEPSAMNAEQFAEMVSFPHRDKVELLPQSIIKEVQDGFVYHK